MIDVKTLTWSNPHQSSQTENVMGTYLYGFVHCTKWIYRIQCFAINAFHIIDNTLKNESYALQHEMLFLVFIIPIIFFKVLGLFRLRMYVTRFPRILIKVRRKLIQLHTSKHYLRLIPIIYQFTWVFHNF